VPRLAEHATAVARELPGLSNDALNAVLQSEPSPNALVLQRRLGISSHDASILATYLAEARESVDPTTAALLLETAAVAIRDLRSSAGAVELVWTGPALPQVAARQTEPALRDLVAQAKSEVVIAGYSFSAGAKGFIRDLAELASRGVRIWIIAEQPEQLEGFRDIVGARIRISTLVHSDPAGSLHAKVTVVDRRHLLITSANFTSRGFRSNVELGVLITGPAAGDAAALLDHLAGLGFTRDVTL
jgi:phosphatidylserine/phosphatidylglycerophosphate/cardiolipin synthase-like enzyme